MEAGLNLLGMAPDVRTGTNQQCENEMRAHNLVAMQPCISLIFVKHASGKSRRNFFFLPIKCVVLYAQNKVFINVVT